MSFVSYSFLLLFAVAWAGRLTFGRNKNEKSYLLFLLVLSLIFYASYIPAYLFLLLGVTAVDFYAGRKIAETADQTRKKWFLFLSVGSNLGLLGFYKYSNFLLDNFELLSRELGIKGISVPAVEWALPLGISFFTFQSISYTFDIYRGVLRPLDRYWRFLLFVSFFTHLVSGPIVRARELVYQFDRKRRPRLSVGLQGAYYMIRGFFLKMVVADNLAYYVNKYWKDSLIYGGSALFSLLLAFLFACQILADFEGYSNIAMGSAYLLGFRLPFNFNNPYLARTFKEFWTRWHITLSRWMRDYLYIPLGGNRVAEWRNYVNLLLVMVIAGFWHGAAYTFLFWGALHGIALVLERMFGIPKLAERYALLGGAWYFVVQAGVLAGWIFFRAESLDQAFALAGNLFKGGWEPASAQRLLPALAFTLPTLAIHFRGFLGEAQRLGAPSPFEKAAWAALMLYGILSLYGENSAFIYFQF
ncbi:MAG TPA: MBOAT family O-acyltransferase [bacterium]|nr:MBOAT family O-acyltransferase [bacterium]